MEIQFNAIRKSLAESIQLRVEDVPEYKIKTPLQRTIQILKRHRDIWFDKNQSVYDEKAKPISMIITTLAAHVYNNESDLQQTLLKIVREMSCHIKHDGNGVALIPNPVNPFENLADKWQEHPIREACFTDWLRQAQLDLNQPLEVSNNIQRVGKSLKPCLGERVIDDGLRNLSIAGSHPASTPSNSNLSKTLCVMRSTNSKIDRMNRTVRNRTYRCCGKGDVRNLASEGEKHFRTKSGP